MLRIQAAKAFLFEQTVGVMGLTLKLLGRFQIRDSSGQSLSLPTRKARVLLAYLAINAGRPQPRERLMALLWGDRGERQARQNLNYSLRAIRKLVEEEAANLIESDAESVMLRREAVVSDAARLRELVAERPDEAAELYGGPFLDGLSIPDPTVEEWLREMRLEFHTLACRALEAAADTDNTKSAISSVRRLLALDPLREDVHRNLMKLLYELGDRTGALRQYQACAEVLERELQVEPDTATRELYEGIKRGSVVTRGVEPVTAAGSLNTVSSKAPHHVRSKSFQRFGWQALTAAIILLAIGGGAAMWLASVNGWLYVPTKEGGPVFVSDKPSIAVLPFTNLSGDKEQEYFSDGMTEDLLTDLSKISALRVISRTSTFSYKGKAPDIRTVAKELGVSHVVEGSVRKVGERVRITAQLIDAATGSHLWSERYDRELEDIFALQDEVRGKIISALAVKLATTEEQRVARKGTESVEAYDLFLKGRHQESPFKREQNAAAIHFYRSAINIDPGYSNAYARLANMYDFRVRLGWSSDIVGDRNKAFEYAKKALELDNANPFAHWTQGRIVSRHGSMGVRSQLDAIRSLERAIELDPNYADAYAFISFLYVGVGEPKKALEAIELAMKLNPQYPFWYLMNRAIVRYMQTNYEAAVADLERAVERNPTAVFLRWWLAAAYAQAGRQDDAQWQVEEMRGLGFSSKVKEVVETTILIRHPPYRESYADGLRKAGIPE